MTHWEWSPLIHDAYRRNRKLFVPDAASALFGYSAVVENYTDPILGLLALHVRGVTTMICQMVIELECIQQVPRIQCQI